MISRKKELRLLVFAAVAIAGGMMLNLGEFPLYLEEPRRAIIAMEMRNSGNYWVQTLLGDWYYNKPPVFTWILLLFSEIGRLAGFSSFHAFWLRLPTVLSCLGIAALLYREGKRQVHPFFGARVGLTFLTFGGILLFFSALAEIDLFYTLVVFSGMLVIWHFGEQQAYWPMFLLTYALCAVGVMTKGLPSFAFTAISLLVFALDKRKPGMLFSFAHAGGILLLALLLGGYILQYASYHPPIHLLDQLVNESVRRTPAGAQGALLPVHLLVFPLNMLVEMLPGSLMVLFLFRRDIRNVLLERHPFIRFCTLILLANLLLYWISPGTRMRYIYPLLPLGAIILVWGYELRAEAPAWASRFLERAISGLMLFAGVGVFVLMFMPQLRFLPWLIPLSVFGAMAFGMLWWMRRRYPVYTLVFLFVSMAMSRLVFDLVVLPFRAHDSGAQRDKDLAARIHCITNDHPLYFYGEEKVISYTATYYLNRQRRQNVILQDQLQQGTFYLLPKDLSNPADSVLLETTYENKQKVLILKAD